MEDQLKKKMDERVEICGVFVSGSPKSRVIEGLGEILATRREGKPFMVVTVNPEQVVQAAEDDAFRHILNNSSLAVADGVGVALGGKLLGKAKVERVSGVELAGELVGMAWKMGLRVAMLGGGEGVSAEAKNIKIGPGLDPSTQMGPLVSETQFSRVCGYLDSGFKDGAKAITGGKKLDGKGYFVEPTVLVNTKPGMKVVDEEIFGPVVTAMPFKQFDDEIVRQANNTIYGLAAGIWTRDVSKAHALAAKLQAGTVWVNCYNIFDASLPFGGYKQSGWGREMGEAVLDNYTESKVVTVRI